MAIVDYAGLVEAAQKWCVRSDSTFTNQIPNMLAFAEDRIYNGSDLEAKGQLYSPALRTKSLEFAGTVAFTEGLASLPLDCLQVRKLSRSSDYLGLDYLPPERFAVVSAQSTGGDPGYYTIEAGVIKVTPSFTGSMDMLYYRKFPALSTDANSNGLLLAHAPVYLSALLFEAFSFIQNIDLAIGHVSRLRSAIDGLNRTQTATLIGGGNVRVRARNPIP